MTTAAPSTALATIQPAFTAAERLALAGYLAGHRGLTREAYTLDLRQFTSWCRARSLSLFSVRRADIESFARQLEANGRARATVTRRLCTIAGFYEYAVEDELLDHPPAAHVRRPRVDYGRRADRHGAGRLVRKTARRAGIAKAVTPHTLRHAFITAALDAGVPRRTSEGPLGVGATMVYAGTFLGRSYEAPVACTGFAENKQLATATTGGRSTWRWTRRWSQRTRAPS